MEEAEWNFAGLARFLDKSFIPKNIAVCDTLRELVVQFPPGKKFKVRVVDCGSVLGIVIAGGGMIRPSFWTV